MWHLVSMEDGESIALGPGEYRVGRSQDCHIFLNHPHISRRHALLQITDGGLLIQDLESSNGTLVNGQRITSASVNPGDTIGFGSQCVYRLTWADDGSVENSSQSVLGILRDGNREMTFGEGTFLVGRGADSDLRFEPTGISRRHAQIISGPGGIVLFDLGSTNGTWINGEPAKGQLLTHGDTIRFGSHSVTFCSPSSVPSAPLPISPCLSAEECPPPGESFYYSAEASSSNETTDDYSGVWIFVAVICALILFAGGMFLNHNNGTQGFGGGSVTVQRDDAAEAERLRREQETAREKVLALARDEAFLQRLSVIGDYARQGEEYLQPAADGLMRTESLLDKVEDNFLGRAALAGCGMSELPELIRTLSGQIGGVNDAVEEMSIVSNGLFTGLQGYSQAPDDRLIKELGPLATRAEGQARQLCETIEGCRTYLDQGASGALAVAGALDSAMPRVAVSLRDLGSTLNSSSHYLGAIHSRINQERQNFQTLEESSTHF